MSWPTCIATPLTDNGTPQNRQLNGRWDLSERRSPMTERCYPRVPRVENVPEWESRRELLERCSGAITYERDKDDRGRLKGRTFHKRTLVYAQSRCQPQFEGRVVYEFCGTKFVGNDQLPTLLTRGQQAASFSCYLSRPLLHEAYSQNGSPGHAVPAFIYS